MYIACRVDASSEIGIGHVMRCLALAEILREQGCVVYFFCSDLVGNLNEYIRRQKGFEVVVLEATLADELATRQALQQAMPETGWEWLIVDHYGWDSSKESSLRNTARNILVIDDLANRSHDCDILLDQNYHPQPQERYVNRVPAHCDVLLGPSYSLLRAEFAEQRRRQPKRSHEIRRLLVSFGGSDPTGETGKTLQALQQLDCSSIFIDVILGGSQQDADQIEALANSIPHVTCYRQISNMAEHMAQADLFVGAGGSTTWERMSLGLSGIVIATAENQLAGSKTLSQDGYQVFLGSSKDVTSIQIQQALQFLLSQPAICRVFGDRSAQLVDGMGCARVTGRILQQPITLRRATLQDSQNIFSWRNHEETRNYIFQPKPIDWDTHDKWFRSSLQNSNRYLLIGEQEGVPIGVLRYDRKLDTKPNTCVVSIYRVPDIKKTGIGAALLRAGTQWLKANVPDIEVIEAEILPQNIASLKSFEKAGYFLDHMVYKQKLYC